jgi:ABC-type lipoprotein export system ATPase subunit
LCRQSDDVVLDQEERRRHLYIAGQTGTGKSTLLLNLIRQDLAARQGAEVAAKEKDATTA